MSLIIKNVIIKNFLSVGQNSQTINLNNEALTLILGENTDIVDSQVRNGTGKTTGLQAISYALYGSPINNIRKDNLINRTNGKNMLVSLEFSVKGIDYKIERGRKPNLLRFYVNNALQETKEDAAQGENKQTQSMIESIVGMSHEMFKHLVILNTYTTPFLALGSNDQRLIIEQLLGITMLSEKAELVKEQMRTNKDSLQQEEFRIKATEESNKRVKEQIDALKRRQKLWQNKHNEDLQKLTSFYEELNAVDIEQELLNHASLKVYENDLARYNTYLGVFGSHTSWAENNSNEISKLEKIIKSLTEVDIQQELENHKSIANYQAKKKELDLIQQNIARLEKTRNRDTQLLEKLAIEIATLHDHKCYACGQEFHDETQQSVLEAKQKTYEHTQADLALTISELAKNTQSLFVLNEMPEPYYKTEIEALAHKEKLTKLQHSLSNLQKETNPFEHQMAELGSVREPMNKPVTHYSTESEAIEHRSTLNTIISQIDKMTKEIDPYGEQIVDMEEKAIQVIDFENINKLVKHGDHLKFLHDLLTNKDSFIRKKIIEQNLTYLNSRLSYYLEQMGLPHEVEFKNDLTVEITELGREMDYWNFSRGEMGRVILSLSWAFRDVWESLYYPINLMCVDELLDNGTDGASVENSLKVLKEMNRNRNKSIWLISHKDELTSRVSSVLKVIKSSGFTSYQMEEEKN